MSKLKPLCTEIDCSTEAAGIYPIHEENPVGSDEPMVSQDDAWNCAVLCDAHAREMMVHNPEDAPAPVLFA